MPISYKIFFYGIIDFRVSTNSASKDRTRWALQKHFGRLQNMTHTQYQKEGGWRVKLRFDHRMETIIGYVLLCNKLFLNKNLRLELYLVYKYFQSNYILAWNNCHSKSKQQFFRLSWRFWVSCDGWVYAKTSSSRSRFLWRWSIFMR